MRIEEESDNSSDSGVAINGSDQSTGNSGGDASGIGSEGSNASGYGDTEIAIDVDPKDTMLRAGEPTNSMATGEPKEYNAAESLAVITGSGVAVATLAANAGGLANAAADIASAAVAAAAEKAAAVIAEYTAKFAALPASVPVKIADYTGARVGKTKDDKNRNGIAYDPVKLSIGDLLGMGEMNTESLMKEMDKSNEEIAKNKKTEEVQKKLKNVSDSVNQKIGKSAEVIGEIMTHVLEGPEWIQQQIDKEVSRVEQNVRSELETGYKKAEEEINTFCENEGDKIGAVIVEQYNKTVAAAAKTIIDNKNKAISQAKIKSNAAIQKAKLKIFALIGL